MGYKVKLCVLLVVVICGVSGRTLHRRSAYRACAVEGWNSVAEIPEGCMEGVVQFNYPWLFNKTAELSIKTKAPLSGDCTLCITGTVKPVKYKLPRNTWKELNTNTQLCFPRNEGTAKIKKCNRKDRLLYQVNFEYVIKVA